jgi:Ca2+-binding RTX toxin-like protein
LGGALFASYQAAIDGMIIENQFFTEVDPTPPDVLSDAALYFPGVDILPLENRASGLDVEAFLAFAGDSGLLPYLSPDETYGLFAQAPLMGSAGNDSLQGVGGRVNLLAGLGGDDSLRGGRLGDEIYGHDGADWAYGASGDDLIGGGAGSDTLIGGIGNDRLIGGADRDQLSGGAGNDSLDGGAGNDVLGGWDGADVLTGGAGRDILGGGVGADIFVFAGDFGVDRINDFAPGQDRIDLTAFGLSFAQVQAALSERSSGLALDLGAYGGGLIGLRGLTDAGALVSGDFLL